MSNVHNGRLCTTNDSDCKALGYFFVILFYHSNDTCQTLMLFPGFSVHDPTTKLSIAWARHYIMSKISDWYKRTTSKEYET